MSSRATSRPAPDSCRICSEASPGPAVRFLKRMPSSERRPPAVLCLTGPVVVALLGIALASPSAGADHAGAGPTRPDAADLRHHLDCASRARTRLLDLDEASACARAFMRIKLAFVPGIGLDDYDRLPPREKAAVNLAGYRRYVEWRAGNAAGLDALAKAPPSSAYAGH